MATRFTLRAIKCPGCGAHVAHRPGQQYATCDYCGTAMHVVDERPSGPKRRLPSSPGPAHPAPVAPHVRPGMVILFVLIPVVLTIGVGGFVAFSQSRGPTPAPTVEAVSEELPAPAAPVEVDASRASGESPANPTTRPQTDPAPSMPDDDGTEPTPAPAAPKKKRKRKPKPSPYDVGRLLFPNIKGCPPRDLSAPGHPVYYSPTITVTVRDAALHDVSVSVSASDTDLSKLHHKGDYEREVTQRDLDARIGKTKACVLRAIKATEIPSGNPLTKAEGKVELSLTHDGVPYGVKKF